MKAPAFQFYPGDFLSSPDVQIMEAHEVGAYILLLCAAWQSERPGYLPNDEGRLRRLARLTPEQWKESSALVLGKFPVQEGGEYRANKRMLNELDKQESFRQSRAEAGRASAAKRTQAQQDANKNPTRVGLKPTRVEEMGNKNPTLLSSSSSSINKPMSDSATPSPDGAGFEVFWQEYGRKEGSKGKMNKQWDALKLATRQTILNGLSTYKQAKMVNGPQFLPMPQTFLNGRLWEAETFGQAPALTAATRPPAMIPDDPCSLWGAPNPDYDHRNYNQTAGQYTGTVQ